MKLDRTVQRHLLEYFAAYFPDHAGHNEYTRSLDYPELLVHLCYLEKHGLIENKLRPSEADHQHPTWTYSRITAKGLDLLANDGGLYSLFQNFSPRLPAEALRTVLEHNIARLPLPEAEKLFLADHVRHASLELLERAVFNLIEQAFEKIPETSELLLSHLGSTMAYQLRP